MKRKPTLRGAAKGVAGVGILAFTAVSGAALAQQSDLRAREGYSSYGQPISRDRAAQPRSDQLLSEQEPAAEESGQISAVPGPGLGRQPADEAQAVEQARQGGEEGAMGGGEAAGGQGAPGSEGEAVASAGQAGGAQSQALQKLLGKPLVNQQGQELGEIENIVRDRQTQQLKAVVASGGFLGMGAKKVVVPLEQIEASGEQARMQSPMSQDELRQMAAYEEENFEAVEVDLGNPPQG